MPPWYSCKRHLFIAAISVAPLWVDLALNPTLGSPDKSCTERERNLAREREASIWRGSGRRVYGENYGRHGMGGAGSALEAVR